MTALDELDARIGPLCDDEVIELPVRLVRAAMREALALEDDLEFARAFVPEDLEHP